MGKKRCSPKAVRVRSTRSLWNPWSRDALNTHVKGLSNKHLGFTCCSWWKCQPWFGKVGTEAMGNEDVFEIPPTLETCIGSVRRQLSSSSLFMARAHKQVWLTFHQQLMDPRAKGQTPKVWIYIGFNDIIFTIRVVKHWNRLPRELVDALSL